MKKIYRQLLLFTSAVVFMALAPLVVFYAMGYRIGIDADSDLSVGVLLVETIPRAVQVSIDGRTIGTTPESISNLPPGEVIVDLEQPGYQPWRKRLAIEPTEVTELRSVRLFPQEITARPLLTNTDLFSLAPNRQLIAASAERQLHIISEEGAPLMDPVSLGYPLEQILWSPDSTNLLLLGKNSVALFNVTDQLSPQLLPRLARAREITWDPRIPGRILAILPTGNLEAYHLATKQTTRLASNVETFATSSRNIFVIPTTKQEISILNLQGQLQRSLPFVDQLERLLVTPSGDVAVWYASGTFAILNQQQEPVPIADTVLRAGFSPDGQLIYIQTDTTSLHVFNHKDDRLRHIPRQELQLVLRLSRDIQDPQWFAGGHHLIYQVDDEIIITEIDTRDHPISYTVDSTNLGQSSATVGQAGDTLFYLKKNGAKQQLMAAPLIVEEGSI